MTMLLEVKEITVHYGKARALAALSLKIAEGDVVTIIGANGAGKSTILKALSGMIPLTAGEIWFRGRRIDGIPIHEIVKWGLVHIPEGRRLFPQLSVLVNLKLGAFLRKDKIGIKTDLDMVFKRFPRLIERRNQTAGTLSGGEQQMLAIGRSLLAKPKLLLMDEPSLGLAPLVVNEVAAAIRDINQGGVNVILVEENVPLALRIAHRGYVLQVGKIVLEGDRDELKGSEIVRRAYLGG
jgi:branched-chain amino acid transport system ATP-binding protein